MQNNSAIAAKDGKYSIWWDDARGSVLVDLDGFWTESDMRDFIVPLERAIDRSRARHGNALLLFDAMKNQLLPSPLFENVKSDSKKLSNTNDRIAIVLNSSLLKLQMKRISSTNSKIEFFISRKAADIWLHAHIATPRSSSAEREVAPAIRQVG